MASASPNYVMFLGASRYLYRPSSDAALNPTAAISISVTVDPEGAGAVTNGTLIGKARGDNSQLGWKVEYIASTQKVKCTVYGAGDGSIYVSRETSTVVTHRRNITFTYAAGGTLNAYLDGTLDNGAAASAGTFVAIHQSTERLALAAESTSGTPSNVWKGLLYMAAVFDVELTGGQLTGQVANGVLTGTLEGLAGLKAYWRHTNIACTANNDYASWVDVENSWGLTAAGTPLAQQTSGTAILTLNLWDANLSDLALGGQGLSTTYTLSAPYRLWGAAQNEPQIASGYRSYRGDFTAVIRARRVAGRSTSKIFRRRGIYFEYILASQELYCIVGDDNVGSANKRIGWGFKLFPIEGVDAVYVLRYNAAEQDIDLFLNQIKYAQVSNTSTTSNEQTTGMFVGESTDWQSCAITPKCLSDEQVDTFVLGLAQNTFPIQEPAVLSTYFTQSIDPLEQGDPGAVPATDTDSAFVVEDESEVYTPNPGQTTYTGSPTVPLGTAGGVGKYEQEVDDYVYTDPNPVIDTADYVGGDVTVIGDAGPIEGESVRAWAEIEINPGEFAGVGDVQFPVALKTRQPISFTFPTAPSFNAAGFNVRIAIQPRENARRVYYSAPATLTVVPPTNPNPVMVSAPIGSDANCTATANAGATNMGNATVWFEEETTIGSGTYQRVSAFDTGESFASNRDHVMVFSLGSRTGHTGRKLRFAMQQESNPATVFYSAGFTLTDYSYVAPAPSVQSHSITIGRAITATGRAGPTDVGPCATWWELEITSGEFIAVLDKRTGVDLTAQTDLTDTFTIPPNFALTGKSLRFVVQPNADPGAVYYSSAVTLTDPAITDPAATITAASCSLTKLLTASVNIGTSNAGPATGWWEVEHDIGEWTSILDTTAAIALTSGQTRNLSYQLPSRLSLTGKNIRFVLRSTLVPEQTWFSPNYAVTQVEAIGPVLTVTAATQDGLGNFSSAATIGVTNLGNFDVRWEAAVQGDFVAICEPITGQATSPSIATNINAAVSLPTGLDLVGVQVRLVARSNTFPELAYTSSPFTVTSTGSVLPSPTMTAATESANNVLALTGTTVASSISSARVWFEVANIGSNDFDGRFGEQVLNLTSPQTISATITLPNRLDLTGRTVILRVSPAARPDIVYDSAPLSITVSAFVNPLPAVLTAGQSLAGVFTATGEAGVSDIGVATVWWEAEMTPNEFVAIMERATVSNLNAGRQTINANVTLPARFDLTGKSVRLAVQQNSRPDNIYYSTLFPVTVATVAPPSLTITAAAVSITDQFTGTVNAGINNLGNVKTWWEVEVTAGEFTALFDTQNLVALPPGGTSYNAVAPLPARFDLTGKVARFAVQWLQRPEIVYYSATFPITVANLTDPAPLITAFSVDVWGDCAGTVRAGPTNAAFCKLWWEISIGPSGEFIALFDTIGSVNLFSQQVIGADFILPRGEYGTNYDFSTKQVRVAVQPNVRPETIYYSPPVDLSATARVNPAPSVTSVAPLPGIMLVQGQAGPTNMGNFAWWVEVEYNDEIIVESQEQAAINLSGLFLVNLPLAIPRGWSFDNKNVRLAFSPTRDRETIYYSPWWLTSTGFDNSGDGSVEPGPSGGGSVASPLPKGPGVWRRRIKDFS